MLKKWTTEKAIIRGADRLVSSKENLDALSWSRVEEIADRLRGGSASPSECSELARELIAIAQANKSALGKLGLADAEGPAFCAEPASGVLAGRDSIAEENEAAEENKDEGQAEGASSLLFSVKPVMVGSCADQRTKFPIPTHPDDSLNLPEWAVQNNESDSVAAFFAGEGESADAIRPVIIPRGEGREVPSDTQLDIEAPDGAWGDGAMPPCDALSGQPAEPVILAANLELQDASDDSGAVSSEPAQSPPDQVHRSENKKPKVGKKGKSKKSKKAKKSKKDKKGDKDKSHSSHETPPDEDACRNHKEIHSQEGETMAEEEKPQIDASTEQDSRMCSGSGDPAGSDGCKSDSTSDVPADFARFRSIYSSRDGAFALFEDHEGHITAVDTSKLA